LQETKLCINGVARGEALCLGRGAVLHLLPPYNEFLQSSQKLVKIPPANAKKMDLIDIERKEKNIPSLASPQKMNNTPI
jgi:hypothetical protein